MSLLRISNSFRNWMIVWGMLIVGHVAGLLLYCGLPTAYESVWLMAMLPISAIAFAAIGPLSIVLFFLPSSRWRAGHAGAVLIRANAVLVCEISGGTCDIGACLSTLLDFYGEFANSRY